MEFRHKKRFGQNFLRDAAMADRIVAAAELGPGDRVLEIGPGLGVLTGRLLAEASGVVVLEVDRELAERLRQRPETNLEVYEGDALRLPWEEILRHPPYTLVANLPYNISSQILFKVLDHRVLFRRLVLMFQKEVADRLCASPGTGDYGILTVFCRQWFDVQRIATVPPGAFSPPPKVTSAVLRFDALPQPRVAVGDEALLRRVVKAAFGQRRKTLRNALAAGFPLTHLDAALQETGIDPGRRGETLDLAEFARLSDALQRLAP